MRVRVAAAADLLAVRALLPRSVRGLSAGYYTARQVESSIRHVFGPDTQLTADGTCFVAQRAGVWWDAADEARVGTLYGGDQASAAGPRPPRGVACAIYQAASRRPAPPASARWS
ncbi:MAG: hypothetical protein KY467_06565 [Gemmatimonadetes bacterium]|nr:hypothetical protein [Gemmatimonadota bacterium]